LTGLKAGEGHGVSRRGSLDWEGRFHGRG
jgi:hypothetical protein